MASRAASRLPVITRALWNMLRSRGRRPPAHAPRRILIAHHLLLGDTLMLTPLLALEYIFQHPEEAKELARRGREHAHSHYYLEAMLERTELEYQTLLEERTQS